VDYKLALRLVLVNWPSRIVDFIFLELVSSLASSTSRRPPIRAESVQEVGGSIGDAHRYNKEAGMVEVTS
jgi:hypothetical protein